MAALPLRSRVAPALFLGPPRAASSPGERRARRRVLAAQAMTARGGVLVASTCPIRRFGALYPVLGDWVFALAAIFLLGLAARRLLRRDRARQRLVRHGVDQVGNSRTATFSPGPGASSAESR